MSNKDDLKDKIGTENGNGNGNENENESDKKNKSKYEAFMNWIWNPNKKQFLGRTGSSWAKVGVFYLIFYACLALFWAIMLKIFFITITYERPKWVLEESLIGLSPGLGFRPSPRIEKVDSTLIHFRVGQNASYHHWVRDLENYLAPYKEQYNSKTKCRGFPTRAEGCPFVIDVNSNTCGPNFGYDTGNPCVLIKLNRVYNWKPNPYRSVDEIRNGLKKNRPKPINIDISIADRELSKNEGLVTIQCEGEHGADREKLGTIEYWPKQGLPAEYFPYLKQENYLSPFVLVRFKNPTRGSIINIECIAVDRNIEIDRTDREGSVSFQLLIDN